MKKIVLKIVFLAVISTLLTGLSVGFVFTYFNNSIFESKLESTSKQLYSNFDRVAKLEVNTAISLLTKIKEMEDKGLLKNNEAKFLAANLIRDLRYEKDGYFWIDTYDGTNVVYIGSPSEGKNRINIKDVNGKYLIKEIIEKGRAGGGYTDYWFPKPGKEKPLPKRSYSKAFEPYQWVLGTGNYVDDIEQINNSLKKDTEIQKASIRNQSIIILLVIVLVMTIISIILGRRISKPIKILTEASLSLAKGNMVEDIKVNTKDELKDLAAAFNTMKSKISDLVKEASLLSVSAEEGKLDYRVNSDNFEGIYKTLIIEINHIMDNLIKPLKLATNFTENISKGNIPERITEDYKGDYNIIKDSINLLTITFSNLIKDIELLNEEIIFGNLRYKIPAENHKGEFAEIILGINSSIKRLVDIMDKIPLPIQIIDKKRNIRYSNNISLK